MDKFFYRIFPNESFMDLSLCQFGYEECDPLHCFGPVRRGHYLFHYIISGKGSFTSTNDKFENSEYSLEGGQGFLIWPHQIHTYIADGKTPWVYTWVEFDGIKAKEFVTQAGLTYTNPIYISRNNEEREKVKNEILAIVNSKNDHPLSNIGHLYLFMSALITSSSLRKVVTGGSLRDFYIRECLSFIEHHYQENINVEDIADFCSLDRSYLGKIFKSVLNISPQDFLIRYRINKSCELMKTTDHTISEISEMVGYSNQFNFSRTFKEFIGKSPRNWRNENKYQRTVQTPV